ncbi:MAG: phosphotransferase family protein [Candidatus Dormibacteria bacterium]
MLGTSLTSAERIHGGLRSEVYLIDTLKGDQLVARAARRAAAQFQGERWAIDQALSQGLPMAAVRHIAHFEDPATGGPVSVCIQDRLEGISLDRLAAGETDAKVVAAAVAEAGAAIARLHTIETVGFGPINHEGFGADASYVDGVCARIAATPPGREVARSLPFDPVIVDDAKQIVLTAMRLRSDVPPRLLHGDFKPAHVFIADGRVTGLIDLELCCSGDPLDDFAIWDYWFRGQVPTEQLWAGYGITSDEERAAMDIRLRVG